MKPFWVDKAMSATGFAALLFALFLGYPGNSAAQPVPPCTTTAPLCMTIKIYNNSGYNIYPVLTTGISAPDTWLQAWFKVDSTPSRLAANPYPRNTGFRFYINPTGPGIPPNGFVTITLPLYTQLVSPVVPTAFNQYIDWWNGGRIEIFDGINGNPPAALTALYTGVTDPKQVKVTVPTNIGAVLPSCVQGCPSPLQFFMTPAGIKNNEPEQLTEFTLGAVNANVIAPAPYQLDEHNVDYDVSYVDTAYLPVAMEPYNNTQVGYIGSPLQISRRSIFARPYI
jgi:hypothetical protein